MGDLLETIGVVVGHPKQDTDTKSFMSYMENRYGLDFNGNIDVGVLQFLEKYKIPSSNLQLLKEKFNFSKRLTEIEETLEEKISGHVKPKNTDTVIFQNESASDYNLGTADIGKENGATTGYKRLKTFFGSIFPTSLFRGSNGKSAQDLSSRLEGGISVVSNGNAQVTQRIRTYEGAINLVNELLRNDSNLPEACTTRKTTGLIDYKFIVDKKHSHQPVSWEQYLATNQDLKALRQQLDGIAAKYKGDVNSAEYTIECESSVAEFLKVVRYRIKRNSFYREKDAPPLKYMEGLLTKSSDSVALRDFREKLYKVRKNKDGSKNDGVLYQKVDGNNPANVLEQEIPQPAPDDYFAKSKKDDEAFRAEMGRIMSKIREMDVEKRLSQSRMFRLRYNTTEFLRDLFVNRPTEWYKTARHGSGAFVKSALNYAPVVGALVKKDKAVDRVMHTLEDKIQGNTIDGKELYEVMYNAGVNNIATRNSIKNELQKRGVAIEGQIESRYKKESKFADFVNNIGLGAIGFGKYKLRNIKHGGIGEKIDKIKIGNIGDGLQVYGGENNSKRDAFKRNKKIGGEVSALLQGTAIAGCGYYLYQGISSAVLALDDSLQNTKYHGMISRNLGWATALLGASAAINSGSLTTMARSASNVYAQSADMLSKGTGRLETYLNRKGYSRLEAFTQKMRRYNGDLADLVQTSGQALMLGTIADTAYNEWGQHKPFVQEQITRHEPVHNPNVENKSDIAVSGIPEFKPSTEYAPLGQRQEITPDYTPTKDFTSSQLEQLSKEGVVYDNSTGEFRFAVQEHHKTIGGISHILRHLDGKIGDDTVMSRRDSGLLAFDVAKISHGVYNIGDTFPDLKDPTKNVIHPGETVLHLPVNVVKSFFN